MATTGSGGASAGLPPEPLKERFSKMLSGSRSREGGVCVRKRRVTGSLVFLRGRSERDSMVTKPGGILGNARTTGV